MPVSGFPVAKRQGGVSDIDQLGVNPLGSVTFLKLLCHHPAKAVGTKGRRDYDILICRIHSGKNQAHGVRFRQHDFGLGTQKAEGRMQNEECRSSGAAKPRGQDTKSAQDSRKRSGKIIRHFRIGRSYYGLYAIVRGVA